MKNDIKTLTKLDDTAYHLFPSIGKRDNELLPVPKFHISHLLFCFFGTFLTGEFLRDVNTDFGTLGRVVFSHTLSAARFAYLPFAFGGMLLSEEGVAFTDTTPVATVCRVISSWGESVNFFYETSLCLIHFFRCCTFDKDRPLKVLFPILLQCMMKDLLWSFGTSFVILPPIG